MAPSASAEPPVNVDCSEVAALFGTGAGAATAGEVAQLGAETCKLSIEPTNTNQFTLEGSSSGESVLEAAAAGESVITGSASVKFTLSGLTISNTTNRPAVALYGDGGVTIVGDDFTSDAEGGLAIVNFSPGDTDIVEGNTFSGDTTRYEGGGFYVLADDSLVVRNNIFRDDHQIEAESPGGGGLTIYEYAEGAKVLVDGNTFEADESAAGGGGAAIASNAANVTFTVHGNLFKDNLVAGEHTGLQARVGGGLLVGTSSGEHVPFSVVQSNNEFLGNSVTETVKSGTTELLAGGAGEWVSGVAVQSTGDRFVDNHVDANDGQAPEGGALGVISSEEDNGRPALPGSFTGSDDLLSGNSTVEGGWGGAVYVGNGRDPDCVNSVKCPASSLTLADSTVVDNTVEKGAPSSDESGALWGSPNDALNVDNSIIYGNTPHPEIYGFATSASFRFSDVCSEAGGPGIPHKAGDICAAPLLNPDGSETTRSPTLNAGSNALVPAGLTTDIDGHNRIAASQPGCPATVDMGAFESTFTGNVATCTPTVSKLRQAASAWLEGTAAATVSSHLKRGTTFTFSLNETARVTLKFTQPSAGREVDGRCMVRSARDAPNRRCTVAAGALTFSMRAGHRRIRFDGELARHKKLKPGTYTVAVTATAAGKTSVPHTLRFTVRRA